MRGFVGLGSVGLLGLACYIGRRDLPFLLGKNLLTGFDLTGPCSVGALVGYLGLTTQAILAFNYSQRPLMAKDEGISH